MAKIMFRGTPKEVELKIGDHALSEDGYEVKFVTYFEVRDLWINLGVSREDFVPMDPNGTYAIEVAEDGNPRWTVWDSNGEGELDIIEIIPKKNPLVEQGKRNVPIGDVANIAPRKGVTMVFLKDTKDMFWGFHEGGVFPLEGVRFVDRTGLGQELRTGGRFLNDLVLKEDDILLKYDGIHITRTPVPAGTEILFSRETAAGIRLPGFLERVNTLPNRVKKHVLSTL